MVEKKFIIPNKMGLHARPAALFVQATNRFQSEFRVIKDGVEVNGKSVMGLMMLAAHQGSELLLKIWGSDEGKALQVIEELFKSKFMED